LIGPHFPIFCFEIVFGARNKKKVMPAFRPKFICTLFLLVTILPALVLVDKAKAGPHLVFDYQTGRVYSQSDAFDRWYPASLTKMMTAYTVFREIKAGRLSGLSPVKISEYALSQPPSKMGFPVGTVLNMDAAIKIILVKSANDIATAIAESSAGSVDAFAALMNKYAREIGMNNSNFVNPHGLFDERQYTSAYDLGLLARRIYQEFPKEASYFAIPAIKVGKRTLQNHNALIQRYPGTIGMKTGFVCAAGLNIVVSAKVRGKTLITVVLGGKTGRERNIEAARLLTSASTRSFSFTLPKLDTIKPQRPIRQPVDMREQVCGKKKTGDSEEDEAANLHAIKQPSLDELEAKYLLPKGSNTRVVAVELGNATGPDPFHLVTPAPETATALAINDQSGETRPALATANLFNAPDTMQNASVISGPVEPKIFTLSGGLKVTIPIARPLR
jgi:D-alanyl-D-alanine carboxypeptidase